MTRRSFLKKSAATVGAVVLAPLMPLAAMPAATSSLRYVQQYDIATDAFPSRLDVLYGVGVMNPNYGVRLMA